MHQRDVTISFLQAEMLDKSYIPDIPLFRFKG